MDEDRPSEAVRPATRADVARLAGVSTAVVSYVLTGARPVGTETEARVRSAIAQLGYRRNWSARALKTGRSDLIGVVLTDITNPFFAGLALEIEVAAAERGHAVLIVNTLATLDDERNLVAELIDRGADGIIIGSVIPAQSRAMLDGVDTPIVWIDEFGSESSRLTLNSSMADGTRELVRHLVEVHGRRRIALAIGDGHRVEPDAREVGWASALADAGLPPGPRAEHGWTRHGGLLSGFELLERTDRPDAIVACSDLIGVGVLRAAVDLGVRVPDDVSVVSFDGTEESEFSSPPLTTMQQPVRALARAAVDTVLNSAAPAVGRSFRGELVIRRSCGCPD